MTKKEFERRYAKRSGLSVKELRERGVEIASCNCGDKICRGWQAVTQHKTFLVEEVGLRDE